MPEFELVASQLFHDKTGAEHLHIAREDKNNVFAIGFGTPSMNSTGVAHILVWFEGSGVLSDRNIRRYVGVGNTPSAIHSLKCSIGVMQIS